MSSERPMVSGTNRKWYIAVSANCRRERSTTVSSLIGAAIGSSDPGAR